MKEPKIRNRGFEERNTISDETELVPEFREIGQGGFSRNTYFRSL